MSAAATCVGEVTGALEASSKVQEGHQGDPQNGLDASDPARGRDVKARSGGVDGDFGKPAEARAQVASASSSPKSPAEDRRPEATATRASAEVEVERAPGVHAVGPTKTGTGGGNEAAPVPQIKPDPAQEAKGTLTWRVKAGQVAAPGEAPGEAAPAPMTRSLDGSAEPTVDGRDPTAALESETTPNGTVGAPPAVVVAAELPVAVRAPLAPVAVRAPWVVQAHHPREAAGLVAPGESRARKGQRSQRDVASGAKAGGRCGRGAANGAPAAAGPGSLPGPVPGLHVGALGPPLGHSPAQGGIVYSPTGRWNVGSGWTWGMMDATYDSGLSSQQNALKNGAGSPKLPVNSFSDRRIIEVLAATPQTHRRLLHTFKRVRCILDERQGDGTANNVELYGSLALNMASAADSTLEPAAATVSQADDWPAYYVNGRSDVDFVVELRPSKSPLAIAQRLIERGSWRLVGQTQVHKFSSTQFTLLGHVSDTDCMEEAVVQEETKSRAKATPPSNDDKSETQNQVEEWVQDAAREQQFQSKPGSKETEVFLDVTCIDCPVQFQRFKKRQEAFRKFFQESRSTVEVQFGKQGALAFDAYIHLLKSFATKVQGNQLTGFQATCLGLFTLSVGHWRMKSTHSIALSFFEGFLRFCLCFFSDVGPWGNITYQTLTIDLSEGGRWLPRMNPSWRAELYFMKAEDQLGTRVDERVNVAHSLDPGRVAVEAMSLLQRAFAHDATQLCPPPQSAVNACMHAMQGSA